uniref:Protein kinase domain-containing protein n=1 Tax=Panagrolaimus sp. PS1159 TaxID=55785 RepID=A0AC35GA20_9BILA
MSDEDLEDELGIRPGATIDTSKAVYVIDHMLGEGGFGAVFLVHDEKNKEVQYALKVEKKLDTRRHSKLKMEIAILKAVKEFKGKSGKENDRFMRHFTDIVDRGKKEKYFFLVMQLVGKSLADLKAVRPNKIFSIGTGLSVAHQCLEAVEGLHGAGYIHRDLKPANYACGPGAKCHTIYILDFGIARMFQKKNDSGGLELKTPRTQVGFKGTVRFASLACHRNHEMGPKDDCESWFYLLLDLVVINGLPWRKEADKKAVQKIKEESRNNKDVLYAKLKCADELAVTLKYLDGLQYADQVDYEYLYNQLKESAKRSGTDLDILYDWEDQAAGTSKSQMKSAM